MPLRLLLCLLLFTPAVHADYSQHPLAASVLAQLRLEHGFNEAEIQSAAAALKAAVRLPQLIETEQKAPERTETWTQYARRIDAARIEGGVRLLSEQRDHLARAEEEFGVPPAVIAAVLGIETRYGRVTGNIRVLDALATQGFDHPSRGDYFRSELVAFLAFCRDSGRDPQALTGSYAGAMGAAQFMPSNYSRLALDYDGDGRRDLWQLPDAIGSIGHYFIHYRPQLAWRRGEPLILPARLKQPLPANVPRNTRAPTHRIDALRRLGVKGIEELPDDLMVGLIELPLDDGSHEIWLGLHNFYAVMTYNPRVFYGMAVARLAQEIERALAAAP
jgi:membrane-bound lytic murein transglycosylase B